MIKTYILPNGNLHIVLTSKETKDSLETIYRDFGNWTAFKAIFENKYYQPVTPKDKEGPFTGYNYRPCVAESIEFDDKGKPFLSGRLWYCQGDVINELLNKGYATLIRP